MQSSNLRKYAPWAAGLGLLGLVVAAALALIYRQFNTPVQAALVIGLLGLVLAVLFSPGAVTAWFGGRAARYGSNAVVMSAAFLGIVVLVNYLATRNPVRWDLSEGQINTFAPQTVTALSQLPGPVTAVGFYSDQVLSQRTSAQALLQRYASEAPDKFSYEFVDPYVDPVRAREYNLVQDGTLFLEMGGERQEVSFVSETEITSALVRFIQPASRSVYVLTGEGEADPADTSDNGLSQVADLLQRQNYTIQPLNLQVTSTIPADARVIVIPGPRLALSAAAVAALEAHLNQTANVSLIALLDPPIQYADSAAAGQPAEPDPLLAYLSTAWGVTVRDDIVVDLNNGAFTSNGQNPLWPVYVDFPPSPLTESLAGQAVVFPIARTLSTTTTAGVTHTPVLQSDAAAWGETDLASLSGQAQPAPDAADAAGPLTLAVTADHSERKTRLVVFGDSDFARNSFVSGTANASLFVAAVNWAARDETLIDLTPKLPTQRALKIVDALTMNAIFFGVVILMPLAVLALGGVVWFLRRRHV